MFREVELEYRGWKYTCELDIEPEENCKILHDITDLEGERVMSNVSPYQQMDEQLFALLVNVIKYHRKNGIKWDRYPSAFGTSNWDRKSLEAFAEVNSISIE